MSIVRYHPREREDVIPWTDRLELAKVVADTDFVPKSLRGNPSAICAAILFGDEVGLGPMQSLAQIAVIEGKPTLSAEAQRALILAAGHSFTVEESTTTRVTVAGRRRDEDRTVRVTWTMDDAKRAGIAGRHNYRTYPRQMLLARATAELARAIFADAIGGLAASEELEGDPDAAAPETPPADAPKTTRRRRSVTTPVETSAVPSAMTAPEAPPVPGDVAEKPGLVENLVIPEGHPEGQNEAPIAASSHDERASEAASGDTSRDERTGDERPLTEAMATALNIHVGNLRDKLAAVSTESLYYAVGTLRRKTPDEVIAEVGGIDAGGVLRWRHLRDSLTRAEARKLREWFEAKEAQLGGPPVPGDEGP